MATHTSSPNHYQMNERAHHCTVSVGDSLYLWAGNQIGFPEVHDGEKKRKLTSNIQCFTLSTSQWINRTTTGTPPLGVIAYSCTAKDDQLYYFGRDCGHNDCYHNSITQLDTVSLQWRELEPTDATRPVMRRSWGGIISFEHDGVHHLLMIGGYGSKPAIQLPYYKYNQLQGGNWRTNEHSIYNLSSRNRSNPSIIGHCILPACFFIIEKINNTRAVLFGGQENDDTKETISNNIYLLEVSVSTVNWQCIKKPEAIDQWPVGRWFHSGAVIDTGSDCPMLVINGGEDKNTDTLDDCWIFNITKHYWKKLDIPHSVSKRLAHSLSVFIMSPHCVWIVNVGGFHHDYISIPNIVMLTELAMSSTGEWEVGDTLDTKDLNKKITGASINAYKQEGENGWRRTVQHIWSKPLKNLVENCKKKKNEKVIDAQQFHQQLEQKEKEVDRIEQEMQHYRNLLQENQKEEMEKEQQYCHLLQENEGKEAQKEQEIQHYCHLLQEKEKKEMEKEQQYHRLLQENERKEAQKEQEIQQYRHLLQEKEKKEMEKEQQYHHLLQENKRKEAQKEQEIQQYRHLLQEKKNEIEKEQQYHHLLQENERKQAQQIQRYYHLLQEKEKELQLQRHKFDNHWVIDKDEVILTEEELGRGSYANVNVGTFRGLKVAVKSLYTITISNYN